MAWTNQTKSNTTFTNNSESGLTLWGDTVATWGDAVAMWGGDARAVWTDGTKHSTAFTNQIKN